MSYVLEQNARDVQVRLYEDYGVTVSVKKCKNADCNDYAIGRATYCTNACRQAAHRSSPAYKACLKKQRDRRLRRKNAHYERKYRFRSLGVLGWSGPLATDVPSIGEMDLKLY